MYVIKFTDEGLADVKALPKNIKNALKAELIKKIATDPENHSTPLTSALKGWRSFHWNEYRVILKVYHDLRAVAIAAVGKHDKNAAEDVYKKLETLVAQGKLAATALIAFRGLSSRN